MRASGKTKIQWTQRTWNYQLGCFKVSPGCKNCYAIRDVHRMAGNPNPKIAAANAGLTIIEGGRPNWTGKINFVPHRLAWPLERKLPTIWFVNSLSDTFHPNANFDWVDQAFGVMALCPQHTFQILTKHPDRMLAWTQGQGIGEGYEIEAARDCLIEGAAQSMYAARHPGDDPSAWLAVHQPLPNVGMGTSVESRDYLHRIDTLRQVPAAVRFLSLEPLLEDLGDVDLTGIDWIIVGGESWSRSRGMNMQWVRNIERLARKYGTRLFVKQLGAAPYFASTSWPDGPRVWPHSPQYPCVRDGEERIYTKLNDKKGGTMEEWPPEFRIREMPQP